MGFRYCAGVTQRLIKVVLFTHSTRSEIGISYISNTSTMCLNQPFEGQKVQKVVTS
jgi:hypothetical protein